MKYHLLSFCLVLPLKVGEGRGGGSPFLCAEVCISFKFPCLTFHAATKHSVTSVIVTKAMIWLR